MKTKENLTNGERRLICEIKSIAKKISRNKAKGFSTEKLEAAFTNKRAILESKGIKIKDYAMFAV